MSPRYIMLVLGRGGLPIERLDSLSRQTGLEMAFSNGSICAFVNQACACLAIADVGCILGSVFRSHGQIEPLAYLGNEETRNAAASQGNSLLRSVWGGYISAVSCQRSVVVLREPSGTFPCYHATVAEGELFASDAELLQRGGAAVEIDYEEVGRQLYRAFVPSPLTALRGIRELLPGFALELGTYRKPEVACWSPWDHVHHSSQEDTSAEKLSQIVSRCTEAWASGYRRLLLSVSGGLDSSILAACLANCDSETVCLTMFTQDPSGDERPFARELCKHLRLRLVEREYRLEDIDITEALGAHLPRPRDRTQANAYERVHVEVASDIGAEAFVTGNGGDNVFGYSQSAAPVADRYLVEGLGRGLKDSVFDVCNQTGCSIFDAAFHASRLLVRSSRHRVKPNTLFLDPEFVRCTSAMELDHPWLNAPTGALPGQAAHVANILRVQPTIEASRGCHLPVLSPLLSQPLVEVCLKVPSWKWREGGRDRALARDAFAGDLPAIILKRRVKGSPSRFAARLLDHFRSPIRQRLLDGRLATRGIVDARRVAQVLAGDRPVSDLDRVRILELVNAEAWLDRWASRSLRQGEQK